MWLDVRFMPAAAYTALSRVARMEDLLLGGELAKEHFVASQLHTSRCECCMISIIQTDESQATRAGGKKEQPLRDNKLPGQTGVGC